MPGKLKVEHHQLQRFSLFDGPSSSCGTFNQNSCSKNPFRARNVATGSIVPQNSRAPYRGSGKNDFLLPPIRLPKILFSRQTLIGSRAAHNGDAPTGRVRVQKPPETLQMPSQTPAPNPAPPPGPSVRPESRRATKKNPMHSGARPQRARIIQHNPVPCSSGIAKSCFPSLARPARSNPVPDPMFRSRRISEFSLSRNQIVLITL
jgi:hypothetical protein